MLNFLTGLAAGFAIAYLTAPGTGKQTRDTLVNFINDEVEGVKLIKNAVSRVDEALEPAKS